MRPTGRLPAPRVVLSAATIRLLFVGNRAASTIGTSGAYTCRSRNCLCAGSNHCKGVCVYETPDDVERLQDLLDVSYAQAGKYLRVIITPDRRVTAERLIDRLRGMRLLVVATVTSDGHPLNGAVDGLFYRGEFWFGSSPRSLRFQHIRHRPFVSATHLDGEPFSVTVHGRAERIRLRAPEHEGFWNYCREVYGGVWDKWTEEEAIYARIRGDRMFTYELRDESPVDVVAQLQSRQ